MGTVVDMPGTDDMSLLNIMVFTTKHHYRSKRKGAIRV